MKNAVRRLAALALTLLLLVGTVSLCFAASAGQVQQLSVAARSDKQIKLKWKAVSGASGYLVESRTGKGAWTKEGYTSKAAYTDKALSPGTKYLYRVTAFKKNGASRVFGKASEPFAAMTNPSRVAKISVAASAPTSVKLKWTPAKGATRYLIYQGTSEEGKFKKIAATQKTTYKVTFKVSPGTVWFKVKSVAKSGELERSASPSQASKAKLSPNAVSAVSVKASTGSSVTLKWAAAKGANGYLIFKKDVSTDGDFVKIGKTAKTSYKAKFSAAPGKVWFKVQAYAQTKSATVKAKVSPAVKITLKPEKVAALTLKSASTSKLKLKWKAAAGASGYEVYLRDADAKEYTLYTTVETPACTIEDLQPGTQYRVAVRSVAAYHGSVLRSGYSPSLAASTVFGEITGFRFSLDSDNKVYLSWDELKGIEGYEVERSYNGEDDWTVIGETKATVFEASKVETGKTLQKGKPYYYRVRARMTEDGEKKYTAYSEIAQVHPITDAPKITRTGTGAQHSICLEWTAVAGADGYEVFFFDEASGAWISLTGEKSPLASGLFKTYKNENGVATVYYSDQHLETSGNYQYRVRAVVKNGDAYNFSDLSNIVSHTYEFSPEPAKYYSDATQKTGIAGYLYDPVEDCFCTAQDPWQRNFGFNEVYDVVSQAVMIQYDTARIQFSCHEGEQWMIQPWKGQYGMVLYGSEIGVYKKYSDRDVEHYDCAKDDDMLMMEMDLYKYNYETAQWDHAFHRPYGSYWWITGFKFGFLRFVNPLEAQSFTTYKDLYIDARITFMDFDMFNAFKTEIDTLIAKEKRTSGQSHWSYSTRKAPEGTVAGNLDLQITYQ